MPVSPETRDRLTAVLSQLVRTGRHVSSRAAAQLYGDLPSFGWPLLVPLERHGNQRCSALAAHAGVDISVASRQLAALERSGYVDRRPDPNDGRASLLSLTDAGAEALAARAVAAGRLGARRARRLGRARRTAAHRPAGPPGRPTSRPPERPRPPSPAPPCLPPLTRLRPPASPQENREHHRSDHRRAPGRRHPGRRPRCRRRRRRPRRAAGADDPPRRSSRRCRGCCWRCSWRSCPRPSSPTPCRRSSPTCAAPRASTPGSSPRRCWPRPPRPRSGASSPTCSARSC